MKRYCICVFWEKNGIVRDYFTYYIKGLQEVAEKILVVVNGTITDESRKKLKDLDVDIMERQNKGLDFGGWKDAIEKIGYEKLGEYNELILTNNSCYGPIYPLSEMFDTMNTRNCDFWGITKHPETSDRVIKKDKTTKIIKHIQSYFLVFKRNMFMSNEFRKFWRNVKYYTEYNKVVGYYEIKFTKHFEDCGFISDTYINFDKYNNILKNPVIITDIQIDEDRLPLVKKKFFSSHRTFLNSSLTLQSNKTIDLIKNKTNYNINLIYDDLIKTQLVSNLQKSLHLNYVLSSENSCETLNQPKIALILHIYYPDLIDYCYNYALSMPENSDIYLVTSREDTKSLIEEKFKDFPCNKLEIRVKPNRGRDVSAYLVTCRDIFDKYDYICCMHDKKTNYKDITAGENFSYHCFECNLKSKDYVKNIINTFNNNPYIGLLCPLPVEFAGIKTIANEIPLKDKTWVAELFKTLNLSIPFDPHPIAPYGSMFWIRGNAIQPLFRKNWQYEDFPEEPLPIDGTISHAIERIYAFVAQEAGYFTGLISPDSYMPVYLDNIMDYFLRTKLQINNQISSLEKIFSITNNYQNGNKVKQIYILGKKFLCQK